MRTLIKNIHTLWGRKHIISVKIFIPASKLYSVNIFILASKLYEQEFKRYGPKSGRGKVCGRFVGVKVGLKTWQLKFLF